MQFNQLIQIAMISINPYLVYNGNCEEAFNFYKKVFGSESLYIGHYKDAPGEAKKFFPNARDENVMHATLQIDETTGIMGNDSADISERAPIPFSRDFYLYLKADSSQCMWYTSHQIVDLPPLKKGWFVSTLMKIQPTAVFREFITKFYLLKF
jgi:uncharacterized glyoxalase superfamily protein PhnB